MELIAREDGLEFLLYTPKRTELSKPLLQATQDGRIIHKHYENCR